MSNYFKLIVLSVSLLAFLSVNGQNKKGYPEFSWDKIPVCIHLHKKTGDFSTSEAKFIARFPIVCIEKSQAVDVYNGMEQGTFNASQIIKKFNPKSKVLFYWNSRIDYGQLYSFGNILDENAHPEWAMTDLKGELVTVQNGRRKTYDPTIPGFRKWWVKIPVQAVAKGKLDGVFVDAVLQYAGGENVKVKQYGEQKYREIMSGVFDMMGELKNQLGKDQLVIANALRGTNAAPDNGRIFYPYIDGAMIEHFCDLSGRSKDVIARDIELLQDAAEKGKIVIAKGWPRLNFTNTAEIRAMSQKQLEDMSRADIVFPLATFLVGAGKYAYFCYSWGYDHTQGGMIDYPEYNKPLGEPLGPAQKNGYIYTREFKNASVFTDIENRIGKIDWK
ncbi:MAG: putative glycoside hydrolase [Paludibacter sp.]|jgi:hypothetical protein|nr:putative glycoside hydrolase [Paludibacter sp.]